MICIKKKILKIVVFLQTDLAKIILMAGILMCLLPVVFFEINDADLVKGLFALAGVFFMLHLAFPASKYEITLNRFKKRLNKKSQEDPRYKEIAEELKSLEI